MVAFITSYEGFKIQRLSKEHKYAILSDYVEEEKLPELYVA
jgi:hypothetical protein